MAGLGLEPTRAHTTDHTLKWLSRRLVGKLFSTERETGSFRGRYSFPVSPLITLSSPLPVPHVLSPLTLHYCTSHSKVLTLLKGCTVQRHTYKLMLFIFKLFPFLCLFDHFHPSWSSYDIRGSIPSFPPPLQNSPSSSICMLLSQYLPHDNKPGCFIFQVLYWD